MLIGERTGRDSNSPLRRAFCDPLGRFDRAGAIAVSKRVPRRVRSPTFCVVKSKRIRLHFPRDVGLSYGLWRRSDLKASAEARNPLMLKTDARAGTGIAGLLLKDGAQGRREPTQTC